VSDASVLFRDIASDAAQKTATKIGPSEDELNQIDKPAEPNTWHEAPDMSRGNMKNTLKDKMPVGSKEMKKAAGDAAQAANPDGSRDPNAAAERTARDQREGTSSGVDHAAGAKAGLQSAKEQISAGMDDETKDQARERKDRTKDYLKDKVPEERRDQTINRLKKMVVEIQGHQDYQQAIDTLLYLAETYSGHTKDIAHQTTGTVKQAHGDTHLQSAERCLKTLIERFANNTSSDDLIDSINDIYRDADKDPQLKGWFRKVNTYIRKVLKEQGYILKDASTDEYNKLYDEGKFLLRDRYRDHTDRVLDEFKFMGDQFAADPQSQRFGSSVQKLFTELGNDENGKPVFKKHLVTDLTSVIVPGIFENVRYVPIPRIEYTDPMMDAIVENLVFESDNFFPNILEIGNDSYFRWGRKSITSKNRQSFMVSVSGIQCDLKDVSYYVKKKTGFPSLTDTGLMDIFLGGEGFSFKMKVASAEPQDRQNFFKVEKVDVNVKNMNIKLKKSKHKLMFAIFKPLLLKVLRPVLQKVMEQQIKSTFTDLDRKAYSIKKEADRAEAELKKNPDPENATNIYSRYASAAQKEFTQKKEKAEAVTADKKANVAITKEDSIFKNINLPGGVSTKATEYKELARQGDRWTSPVFDLGSAKASTNIPSPVEIRRREHNTSRATLRDGSNDTGNYNKNHGSNTQSQSGYTSGTTGGYTAGETGYGSGVGYDNTSSQNYNQNTATTGHGYDSTNTGVTGQGYSSAPIGTGLTSGGSGLTSGTTGQGYSSGLTGAGLTSGTTGQGYTSGSTGLPTSSLPVHGYDPTTHSSSGLTSGDGLSSGNYGQTTSTTVPTGTTGETNGHFKLPTSQGAGYSERGSVEYDNLGGISDIRNALNRVQ